MAPMAMRCKHRPSLPRLAADVPSTALQRLRVGSRSKIKPADLRSMRACALPPLLLEVGEVAAHTGVVPRKELFEAWEVASRVDLAFAHVTHVADLAAGHGLLVRTHPLTWWMCLCCKDACTPACAVRS